MIYDSKHMPGALKDQIYQYIKTDLISEKKDSDTEEQFIYKTRKKGFGPLKKNYGVCERCVAGYRPRTENQFSFLFKKLNVVIQLILSSNSLSL